ncbi:hypothetical protein [Acinetobacter sp. ANC 4178]|uniref:hypothetical protein n=1 Tax=Acinetobacter sp. ANC 4178 TaxID=2529839 RepID=UPI00196B5204|nr:hypothetical protein [Acinetobacter sp. ANC 4178]
MKISEKFNLGLTQAYLDFVDIDLDTDLLVFVDPTALRSLDSPWGHSCASLVQQFFEYVLENIKSGNDDKAKLLLSNLSERNEFHIGFSAGKSRGSGFGNKSAALIWDALCQSKAATTGLLRDIEDSCLSIEGIGSDMISDAICNIIRSKLIEYTQDMCIYYGIATTPNVNSGPIWNPQTREWEQKQLSLPIAEGKLFLLIPKNIVRRKISYDYQEYYDHYILPELQQEHIKAKSPLVHYLKKNGAPRVYKKILKEEYGNTKQSAIDQTIGREHIWEKYKEEKNANPQPPISNNSFLELQNQPLIDWYDLINELKNTPKGTKDADKYEKIIEKIFSALFYPNLNYPTKQARLHEGRKRVDIQYTNEAKNGFFHWLSLHYPCSYIFVECKNYTNEVANPEIDQLAGRFSLNRGKIGLLLIRDCENQKLLDQRCRDTAQDNRGFMISLTDEDIIKLIEDYKVASPYNNGVQRHQYPILRAKFNNLIN